MKKVPVIVLGAGGHARVLIDLLQRQAVDIIGISDSDPEKYGLHILGIPVIGTDESILEYDPGSVNLVNGLGTIGHSSARRQIFVHFMEQGYRFRCMVHDSAIVSQHAELSEGVQIMAGAVIQAGCVLGKNSIVNTGAILDHDSSAGNHVHIAPGATVSGGVQIGDGTFIGAGAVVIQGVKIGTDCVIGAGAAVVRDVPDWTIVAGVPAREVRG